MLSQNKMEGEMPEHVRRHVDMVISRLGSFGMDEFVNIELAEPSSYLLRKPGKLLRPALVFLGADYIGEEDLGTYVSLASAIELLHTSSLVHDDIIDKDIIRRGVEAVHLRFGIESAILTGDALISKAIQESNRYGEKVVDIISKAAMRMCAGEIIDYRYQRKGMVPPLRDYLKAVELKSSELIGVSTSIAAYYHSDKRAGELYSFGKLLGTAFQIRDDVLDFIGMNEKTGYRMNVVKCIREHSKGSSEAALRKAVDLNRKYVKDALSRLGSGAKSALFRNYAKGIELEVDKDAILSRI